MAAPWVQPALHVCACAMGRGGGCPPPPIALGPCMCPAQGPACARKSTICPFDPRLLNLGPSSIDGVHPSISARPPGTWAASMAAICGPVGPALSAAFRAAWDGPCRGAYLRPVAASCARLSGAQLLAPAGAGHGAGWTGGNRALLLLSAACAVRSWCVSATALRPPDACCSWSLGVPIPVWRR